MHPYPRWISRLRGEAQRRCLARARVVAEGVDALALAAFFGVRPDVEDVLAGVCGSGFRRPCERGRQQKDEQTGNAHRIPGYFHVVIKPHTEAFAQALLSTWSAQSARARRRAGSRRSRTGVD